MQKSEFFALIKEAVQEAIRSNKKELEYINEDSGKKNEYSTIKEVAEHFKVTTQTIHSSWIKKGVIKKYKVGGRSLLKINEIETTMTDYPYLFGRGRDYNYRDPKSFTVENKIHNEYRKIHRKIFFGEFISDFEKKTYTDYCIENNLKNELIDNQMK